MNVMRLRGSTSSVGSSNARRSWLRKGSPLIRGFSIAIALYLVFAVSIAFGAPNPYTGIFSKTATSLQLTFGSSAPKYLVLIVLDGARPDYFDMTSLPHLNALRAAGTQYTNAVSGILEAETPSGHAAIATGSRPDRNGILGFDWGSDNGTRYSLFDPAKMASVEQIMQNYHAPTIASLYKKSFPGARVVALSGHKYYAAAPLGGPSADAIIYYQGNSSGQYVPTSVPGHTPPASVLRDPRLAGRRVSLPLGGEDSLVTDTAITVAEKMHPRILLMNYPEFDWPVGHVYGGPQNPAAVASLMKNFDAGLGKVEDTYRKQGILDQTLFVITADHGMMPITRFVPSSVITNAISLAGTSAPDIAADTGDYIWLRDPSKAATVAQLIMDTQDPGIQSTYYLTTVNGKPQYVATDGATLNTQQAAANQYLLSALLNGREPTVVVFGREGATFSDPKSGWKADHGGNSWQSQHLPLILAGPGIRAGQVSSEPAQLEDIAPTVLTDMGVAPTGMEGHVLTGALNHAVSSAAQQSRAAEIAQLGPQLIALAAEGFHGSGLLSFDLMKS